MKRLPALLVVACTALTGCSAMTGGRPDRDAEVTVVASFYPLAWVAGEVAGTGTTSATSPVPAVSPTTSSSASGRPPRWRTPTWSSTRAESSPPSTRRSGVGHRCAGLRRQRVHVIGPGNLKLADIGWRDLGQRRIARVAIVVAISRPFLLRLRGGRHHHCAGQQQATNGAQCSGHIVP